MLLLFARPHARTQIILIGSVKNQQEAKDAAQRCKALTVRGHQIWLWCRHLAARMPGVRLDEGALAVYRNLDGVPIEWVDSMVHADNQPEADEMLRTMQETRAGPASDHLTQALEQERAAQVLMLTARDGAAHCPTCYLFPAGAAYQAANTPLAFVRHAG